MRGFIDRLLVEPIVYNTYQWLVGAPCHARFISEIVQPRRGDRILDIGCGTGASVRYLPSDVEYVGIDLSAPYIEVAQVKYGKRGKFVCADASTFDGSTLDSFDRAFSWVCCITFPTSKCRRLSGWFGGWCGPGVNSSL